MCVCVYTHTSVPWPGAREGVLFVPDDSYLCPCCGTQRFNSRAINLQIFLQVFDLTTM